MTVEFIATTHNFSYEGARINIFIAKKGQGLPKHSHLYAHATFCMSGKCAVRKEGKEVIVDMFSQPINLVANEWHEIEALEDNTVFCNVFSEKHIASERAITYQKIQSESRA